MSELRQSFERRLRVRGLRVTAERRSILEHIFSHFGHFDADALLHSLRKHGSAVSRATVYRTLTHFVDAGLLRRYDLRGRHAIYEPALGRTHHEHLVCVRCGQMYEFVQKRIEQLQDEVCRQHGFLPLSHTLQIQGICERCRRGGQGDVERIGPAAERPGAGRSGS